MTTKLTLLFIVSTISVVGQDLDSTELVTYEGYYLQEYQENNHFEGFWQLELQMTQPEDMPPRLVGKALIYVNAPCDVSLQAFSISKDSLSFITEHCTGENYEFRGQIIGVPSPFEGDHENPVLEGIFIHYKDGRVFKQSTMRFLYSIGC